VKPAIVAALFSLLAMCVAKTFAGDPQKLVPPTALVAEADGHGLKLSRGEGGTDGDVEYHEYLAPDEYITGIYVDWWSGIDGVQIATNKLPVGDYDPRTRTRSGGRVYGHMGGNGNHPDQTHQDQIQLDKEHYLTTIDVGVGQLGDTRYTVITAIRFNVHGRGNSPTFVAEGGHAPPDKTLGEAAEGWEIAGFWGWHGDVLDQIGTMSRKH
jgi:hypothetical protein